MRFAPAIRWSARGVTGLLLAAVIVGPAAGGPPQANAYGKSLPEWMELYLTWYLGGDQADHVKNVQFLPLPAGVPDDGAGTAADPVTLVGEMDLTLKPGTPFVLPVAFWYVEVYLDGSVDPVLADAVFTESDVLVTIDGKAVIDSDRQDLSRFYVPPTAFGSVIYYDEPTSYGSVGAVGFQGIGFVHGPLSVGKHTITLHSEINAVVADPNHPVNLGQIFHNTWNITVKK